MRRTQFCQATYVIQAYVTIRTFIKLVSIWVIRFRAFKWHTAALHSWKLSLSCAVILRSHRNLLRFHFIISKCVRAEGLLAFVRCCSSYADACALLCVAYVDFITN